MRQTRVDAPGLDAEAISKGRKEVVEAFNFVLRSGVGTYIHSYPIWSDYIEFLKQERIDDGIPYQRQQKALGIAKVYQSALKVCIYSMLNLFFFSQDRKMSSCTYTQTNSNCTPPHHPSLGANG